LSVELEYFEEHYDISHPELASPERMWEVVSHLQSRCPVTRSDATRGLGGVMGYEKGFWLLTNYEDCVRVFRDFKTFSSDFARFARRSDEGSPEISMPPISVDPPIQKDFRRLLNPYLSPKYLAQHEDGIRQVITDLIDGFIEAGECDFAGDLARLFPPRVFYRLLFGIEDEDDLARNMRWTHKLNFESDAPDYMQVMAEWLQWIYDFMDSRRNSARRDDIVDSLLHGQVEGRPLTDEEIAGAIRILILGGFGTTTDASSATMYALIQNPELQERLRSDPSEIPTVFDEVIRLEPPVIVQARICTRDVELGGKQLREGDSVVMHIGAANRDSREFDQASELDVHRERNRHVAFGVGAHRCIGSNLARLNMRVLFEEVLSRMDDIRLAAGRVPEHNPATIAWGLKTLPITFRPGKRARA
jgi:cytochrome P450